MRFIQFLIEADEPEHSFLKRDELARKQQQRRDTAKRAELNKQKLSANATAQGATQPAAPTAGQRPPAQRDEKGKYIKSNPSQGMAQRPTGGNDTIDFQTGKLQPTANTGLEQKKGGEMPTVTPGNPEAVVPVAVSKAASGDRATAVEFMTLLGSMYQTKRKNPQAEMTVPKMVTQSKNKDTMQALFDVAKTQDLASLAKMTQQIKQVAAVPRSQNAPQQGGAAPAGQTNVPQAPGATPAQQTVVQNLANKITQAAKSLPPASLKFLKDLLGKTSKKAKSNPMQAGRQQPTNAPVMTQSTPPASS